MKRFRFGIITDEVSQDLLESIKLAKRFGLETLEIRSVYNQGIHQLNDEQLEQIKSMMEQNGLSIA